MSSKPSSCIQRYCGYSLFEGEGGKPYVIRRWRGNREGQGEDEWKEERINDIDALPEYVRFEITAAWKEWADWCKAMKP